MDPEERLPESNEKQPQPKPAETQAAEEEARKRDYYAGGRLPAQPSGQTPANIGH